MTSKYWAEHGDSYIEWLGNLMRQEDSQPSQEGGPVTPPCQPALMDGHAEEEQDSGDR